MVGGGGRGGERRTAEMKKILVIDDAPTVREQVRAALGSGGYQVLEAVDGVDGLQKLQADADIAMVLCDLNMPRMNGLELLDRLKLDGRIDKLPFVLLTSEAQPALIDRARQAGAKAWIVKPFKPALLLAAARRLLGA
jgi:two-component system, chemotaxis family, chemotaxis protein CheY